MILDPFIFMFQIFIVWFVLGCIMNAAKIFAQQAADLTAFRYVVSLTDKEIFLLLSLCVWQIEHKNVVSF